MKLVKIADAKNHLSRHLAYVRAGGRIRILDRDTPVADLVPIEAGDGGLVDDDEQLLASLERRGLARRGKAGALPRSLFTKGPGAGAKVLDALLDERRAGR